MSLWKNTTYLQVRLKQNGKKEEAAGGNDELKAGNGNSERKADSGKREEKRYDRCTCTYRRRRGRFCNE